MGGRKGEKGVRNPDFKKCLRQNAAMNQAPGPKRRTPKGVELHNRAMLARELRIRADAMAADGQATPRELARACRAVDRAEQAVVETAKWLVVQLVEKMVPGCGADGEDVRQEGRFAVVECIRNFDPETVGESGERVMFGTPCYSYILNAIRRWKMEQSHLIRVPRNRIPGAVRGEEGPTPLAARLNEMARLAMGLRATGASRDDARHDPLGWIPDPRDEAELAEEADLLRARLEWLSAALGQILPRQRRVLEGRAAGMTLDSVGRELGVTKERVRQIEAQAMAALRRLAARDGVAPSATEDEATAPADLAPNLIPYRGDMLTLAEVARREGVRRNSLSRRVRRGEPAEAAAEAIRRTRAGA